MIDWLLLAGLIAAYAWYLRGGGVPPGTGRIARYRRWLRRAPAAFGASALAALALGGRLDTLIRMPGEFAGIAVHARNFAGFGGDPEAIKLGTLVALGGSTALGLILARWQARRGRRPFTSGNVERILPRRGSEFAWSAALGVAAAVVEELFFRLALPLFAARATGDAWLGLAIATLLFGAGHRFQGGRGRIFAGVVGALLAWLYLATGALWFTMLAHALLNLNGLVLRPALMPRRDD